MKSHNVSLQAKNASVSQCVLSKAQRSLLLLEVKYKGTCAAQVRISYDDFKKQRKTNDRSCERLLFLLLVFCGARFRSVTCRYVCHTALRGSSSSLSPLSRPLTKVTPLTLLQPPFRVRRRGDAGGNALGNTRHSHILPQGPSSEIGASRLRRAHIRNRRASRRRRRGSSFQSINDGSRKCVDCVEVSCC